MHTRGLVSPILAALMLASGGVVGAAPIVDSESNTGIQQHRVWAVRDRAPQRADNLSVPESVLLQLYRHSTTLNQVGPVDSIVESASFQALASPTAALVEPAPRTTISEPAPFALLVAALGGLFLRRRR